MKSSDSDINSNIFGINLVTNDRLKQLQTTSETLTIMVKMSLIGFGNDMRSMNNMINRCFKILIDLRLRMLLSIIIL